MEDKQVAAALSATPMPRVTDDRIASVIVGEKFARMTGTLTVCVLELANGYTVLGESACASPENYNQELGEHYARENAMRKIWPLEGYLLKQRLFDASIAETDAKFERMDAEVAPAAGGFAHQAPIPQVDVPEGMVRHIGTKIVDAKPMTRAVYNQFRGWDLPSDEDGSEDGYLVHYTDGGKPNVEGFPGYVSWTPAFAFGQAYRPL